MRGNKTVKAIPFDICQNIAVESIIKMRTWTNTGQTEVTCRDGRKYWLYDPRDCEKIRAWWGEKKEREAEDERRAITNGD